MRSESEAAQSCPTLCNPMYCSLQGSSILGIFQARVLGWVAISFSSGSSQPRDWTQVSRIAGRHFTVWATKEALDSMDLGIQCSIFLKIKSEYSTEISELVLPWTLSFFSFLPHTYVLSTFYVPLFTVKVPIVNKTLLPFSRQLKAGRDNWQGNRYL